MKILITGATGYIGANLARALCNDNKVAVITRPTSSLDLIEDIKPQLETFVYDGKVDSLIRCMKDFQPEVVCHLASCFIAEHKSDQITQLVQSNILFGTHFLEAMSITNVKNFINTGTFWQHYNNDEYNPVCLYAATKKAFEDIAKFYYEKDSISCINLILFDTYGPNDPRKKLFYLLKNTINATTPLKMSQGEQELDIVYIDDVIAAYKVAIERIMNAEQPIFEIFSVNQDNPMQDRKSVV